MQLISLVDKIDFMQGRNFHMFLGYPGFLLCDNKIYNLKLDFIKATAAIVLLRCNVVLAKFTFPYLFDAKYICSIESSRRRFIE